VLIVPLVVAEIFCPAGDLHKAIKIIFACCASVILYIYTNSFKTKAVFTIRARRNYLISLLISTILYIIPTAVIRSDIAIFVIYGLTLLIPLNLTLVLAFTNKKFEKKNEIFVKNEMQKLSDSGVIKIGITGSFGKTSCKNILYAMLRSKYNTISTESNFNTPMGIALTIQKMTGQEEIFIAEMGARHRGDIKYLCDMLKPDIGIVTGVCEQHIKTFKSLHQIFLEKSELSKASAVCVFNGNDKYSLKMYRERKLQKFKACVDKVGDVYIDNVSAGPYGSKFSIHINNEVYDTCTKLLGKHNLQNIAICATVANYLNVPAEEIIKAIESLEQVPHRLEYSFHNGIHIIDDGYNSNESGIKYACETIANFQGRKVVVCQGLAECGKKTRELNNSVGMTVGRYADVIILCGSYRRYIDEGLKKEGFSGPVYKFGTLHKAQKHFGKILRKGDVLLLQNDVPDIC